jgi:DNA-binding IclR family transcriptional regulator
MSSKKKSARQGIQSIEVGTRVLRAFLESSRPQMLKDIAAQAQMAPAKAHRYLVSFCRMGLVEQQLETGLYELGKFALELGLASLARLEPVALAMPFLAQLRQETGQTTALAVWANHGATIVRWLGADTPVTASLRVGAVMPITRSATGQIFLAFAPRSITAEMTREEIMHNERLGLNPDTRARVERIATRTRRQGFAFTSDFIPGISGLAAPVFDHTDSLAMSLVLLGYSKPFESELETYTTATVLKAQTLSARLGYRAVRSASGVGR